MGDHLYCHKWSEETIYVCHNCNYDEALGLVNGLTVLAQTVT